MFPKSNTPDNSLNNSSPVNFGFIPNQNEILVQMQVIFERYLQKDYKPNKDKTPDEVLEEYKRCFREKDFDKTMIPMTYEGCIMRISDLISYVGRDFEDAIALGLLKRSDLPKDIKDVLGNENRQIVRSLTYDIINNSYGKDGLFFSKDSFYLGVKDYAGGVRVFKFSDIPLNNPTIDEAEKEKGSNVSKEINEPELKSPKNKDDKKGQNYDGVLEDIMDIKTVQIKGEMLFSQTLGEVSDHYEIQDKIQGGALSSISKVTNKFSIYLYSSQLNFHFLLNYKEHFHKLLIYKYNMVIY